MLQIVTSLTDDSTGVIHDCNIFMTQATGKAVGQSNKVEHRRRIP
jgi:hypothetical protein